MENAHPTQHWDAVILGSGVSGLVSASSLIKAGLSKIIILDEYNHIGGNHIDVSIRKYTFDIGSFFFQDDSPILSHFPELLRHYHQGDYEMARLSPQGRITRYPISLIDDVVKAGPIEWARILTSLALGRTFRDPNSDALSFAQYWLGRRFVERSGLATYMKRFYGVEPDKMDAEFARKRMGWIPTHANLRGVLSQRARAPSRSNRELVRPREGFQALYSIARESLANCGVTFGLGEDFHSITVDTERKVTVSTSARVATSEIFVSTIPIKRTLSLTGLPSADILDSVDLLTLFFSFEGNRGFKPSVLYNFHQEGAWKRVTMHSDFYGPGDGREYFSAEVNATHVGGSVEAAERDFRQHVGARGLFSGDLKLEGGRITANAYPIYVAGAAEAAQAAIKRLYDFGVLSFGRQGGFDYQPTARQSTIVAESAISALVAPPQHKALL